jgi:hypothetical protein
MQLVRTGILNADLTSRASALAEQFKNAEPYPHVAIPGFFGEEFCQRLLDDFPAFDEELARNEMGEVGRKAVRTDVRDISPIYRELDDFIQTPEFLEQISDITGIPDLLYDPQYFGGGTHENLERQGLEPHVDFNYHPTNGWHRRLNLIVYLNPEWEEDWGGNFNLHSNPWEIDGDRISTVLPLFNQGVIFETSERSWHGFSAVRLPPSHEHVSRKSFAIYLYTKDRPADETAASHATIYVPKAMPDDVEPGQVLSDEQYQRINLSFTGHRGLLKMLYEREKQFTKQIDDLKYALEEASKSQKLGLQGYAVQTKAPGGWWPDGWASDDFTFEFSPTKPVRGLELEVIAPSPLKSAQVLEIAANEQRSSHELAPGERRVLETPISADSGDTVSVTVRASASWCPRDEGESDDNRRLAFMLVSALLTH